jgi:hypothetical protein
MAVSKRLRYEILRRDNHTCRYCGDSAPDVKLQVDHVVPTALGGTDEPSNLVTACEPCNGGKSASNPDAPVVDDVAQDALRWSKAMEAAADAQRSQAMHVADQADALIGWWTDTFVTSDKFPHVVEGQWCWPNEPERFYPWGVEINGRVVAIFDTEAEASDEADRYMGTVAPPIPRDGMSSARAWITAGITDSDYVHLMEMVRDERSYVAWDAKWKYFAGCVWNVLRKRQEIASALLSAGQVDD